VYQLRLDTQNPDIDFDRRRQEEADKPTSLFVERNRQEGRRLWVELNPDVKDFHDKNDRFTVTNKERNEYRQKLADLELKEQETLARAVKEDRNYYVIDFSNQGGLVMPILLQITYADGSQEMINIPAEIWRRSPKAVSKLIVTDEEVVSLTVDPQWETADVDVENNHYPRRIIPSRIEAFKKEQQTKPEHRDIMHDSKTEPQDPEVKRKKK